MLWKNPLLSPKIEVISPTRAAFNEFRERQYDGRFALPNDNLAFRDARVGSSRVSVVDTDTVVGPTGVDLTTSASLTLGTVPVDIRASFIETAYESLTIEGEHGLLEFTGNDVYTSWLRPSALRVLDRDGERVEHFAPVDPYRLMIENVSDALRDGSGWLPDPRWSITVAHAMDAIAEAGRS